MSGADLINGAVREGISAQHISQSQSVCGVVCEVDRGGLTVVEQCERVVEWIKKGEEVHEAAVAGSEEEVWWE